MPSKLRIYLHGLLFLCLTTTFHCADIFNATNEWQPVGPDQHIPPGLHVRLNLTSGLKEAKLMDSQETSLDEPSINETTAGRIHAVQVVQDDKVSSHEPKINAKPRQAVDDRAALDDQSSSSQETGQEPFSSKYRSKEELRSIYSQLKSLTKSDSQLITELANQLTSIADASMGEPMADIDHDLVWQLLDDLSDYLHQIDNGQYFMKTYGLTTLRPFVLFNANVSIQQAALRAIGAAVQGNAKAKVDAYNAGLPGLIYTLLTSCHNQLSNSPDQVELAISGLQTLGALLRSFPSGQHHFLDPSPQAGSSGFELLTELADMAAKSQLLIDASSADHQSNTADKQLLALQFQVVSLLTDFAVEKTNSKKAANDSPEDKIKQTSWKLYSRVQLERGLVQFKFCPSITHILAQSLSWSTNKDVRVDHTSNELVLAAVTNLLLPYCSDQICSSSTDKDDGNSTLLRQRLDAVEQTYAHLALTEQKDQSSEGGHDADDEEMSSDRFVDFYFTDMHLLVKAVIKQLKSGADCAGRDEL